MPSILQRIRQKIRSGKYRIRCWRNNYYHRIRMKSAKCPACGATMREIRVPSLHHHGRLPGGRQVKMRFSDVPAEECPTCGERYFLAKTIKEMDQAIDQRHGVRRRRRAA